MKRILIIDDDETSIIMLQAQFEPMGYVVDTAENGKQGLAKMKSFHPDLVITDIVMPEFDGFEFLNALRDSETQTYPCKIIVITAYLKMDYLGVAKAYGVDATFEKPIDLDLLTAKVRELVD